MNDWMGEVVWYRLAVGALGILALAAWALTTRTLARRRHVTGAGLLPATVRDTVAATAFSAAAVLTLGRGVDLGVIASGHGSGQWYSAGLVSAVAAAWFSARLVRELRAPAPG